MTRHIGMFIETTLRPVIERVDQILGKCEHLKLDKNELRKMVDLFVEVELIKSAWYGIAWIVGSVCFCLAVYFIMK